MWEGGLPESERKTEEILLGCLSVRMEEQASKTGELEIDTHCRVPGLREGVLGKQGIQKQEKVLQPRLCQSWQGDGATSCGGEGGKS